MNRLQNVAFCSVVTRMQRTIRIWTDLTVLRLRITLAFHSQLKILYFHAVLEKNWSNNRLTPLPLGLAPPSGNNGSSTASSADAKQNILRVIILCTQKSFLCFLHCFSGLHFVRNIHRFWNSGCTYRRIIGGETTRTKTTKPSQ